jgi:hypothetical protein
MVVGYHDGLRHASAYSPSFVVHHREMNIEANFFSMMAAVARNAKW